jgi:hypothetical protein
MTPRQLLGRARELVEAPSEQTSGWWSRAAAVVARQALERAIADLLERRGAVVDDAPLRAQLVVLPRAMDERLAQEARGTWTELSAATHIHSYELPPTAGEMRLWMDVVERVVAASEQTPSRPASG